MSSEVSPAMQPITGAHLVQKALDLLMPLVTPHKGAIPVSNGTDIVSQLPGADGTCVVYDSTQLTGLNSAVLPAPTFSKFVGGVSVAGNIDITYANPRVAVDPACAQVTLPDGNLATADLEVYVDPGQAAPVSIMTTGGQPTALLTIQPGETVKLSFMDVPALTASWIQC